MTVRVGIIGTGIMGTDHARLLCTAVSGATLAAVSDVDTERAAAVARAYPGVRVLAEPAELIADGGVDAVLIASSDQTHEEYVLACLDRRRPVLCEKPLAPSVAGCRRILAAETGVGTRLVSVGFMRRYDPGYLELRDTLRDGRIGAPLLLHCVHRNPSAPPGVTGAEVITNSAVHELDASRWLLDDEIATVRVHAPRQGGAPHQPGPLFLVLETAGGVLVDAEVYVTARYGYEVRCELVGDAGTVTLDAPPATVLRRDGGYRRGLPMDWRPRFAGAYRRELQDWIDAVRAARPWSGASAWDGYAATAVAQAGVTALASCAPTTVDLDPRPAFYR
ncbi:MAG TPA: Gfo/Idh/MocA family oxidoreductase [Rugosimonospora sp.]|nr:Gfo/Idh/MocA family oxidoreductase [Rugosimonospora sp.]